MLGNLFRDKRGGFSLDSITKKIKRSFSGIKKELNEHLDAINENTNEIQSNYEVLLKLESKIDKIENKLNEIESFIKQFKSQNVYFLEDENNTFTIIPLNETEKKVFRLIYELEAEHVKITYQKIADSLGASTSLAREYVVSLIEKGVPIMKNYFDQQIFLSLEPKFRELQTKKNIVNI